MSHKLNVASGLVEHINEHTVKYGTAGKQHVKCIATCNIKGLQTPKCNFKNDKIK